MKNMSAADRTVGSPVQKNLNQVHQEEAAHSDSIKKLACAGVFAALTYVVFTYFSIRIPTPGGGQVSIHLGNAFVVLGALLLGSFCGGIGGSIGLTIADLFDPVYIVEAPITFIIKFLIGWIAGMIAHKAGHITTEQDTKKIMKWVTIASVAGLAFNAIFDPLLRYWYKIQILGKAAAEVSFSYNFSITLLNSVASLIIVIALYMALRIPLKKAGLFFRL